VLIVSFLIGIDLIAMAQNKVVKLTIENMPPCNPDCYQLDRFRTDGFSEVPFLEKWNDNAVELSFNTDRSGLYQVHFRSGQRLEFLVSPGFDAVVAYYDAADDVFRFKDEENTAYASVKNVLMRRDSALAAVQMQITQVSQIDRNYYRKKESIKLRSDSIKEVFNDLLRQLVSDHPTTFTSTILIPQVTGGTRRSIQNGYEIYDNHHSFYHEHFFDNFPLEGQEILNHPLFIQQLKQYLHNFSGEFNEDLLSSAKRLFSMKLHPAVHTVILKEILQHAIKENLMMAASQITELYLDGCQNSEDIDKIVKAILDGPMSVGSALPEFSIRGVDTEGSASALGMLVTTKPNLLFFWKEGCPRCEEELPLLGSVPGIDPYEVFLIALSSENVAKMNMPLHFHQLCLAEKTEDVFERLGIFKTPTIVICDGVGRILKSPNSLAEL
jgi:hypothetical protein